MITRHTYCGGGGLSVFRLTHLSDIGSKEVKQHKVLRNAFLNFSAKEKDKSKIESEYNLPARPKM